MEEQQPPMASYLPEELLLLIFFYFDSNQLLQARSVCRDWKRVSSALWRTQKHRRINHLCCVREPGEFEIQWQRLVKICSYNTKPCCMAILGDYLYIGNNPEKGVCVVPWKEGESVTPSLKCKSHLEIVAPLCLRADEETGLLYVGSRRAILAYNTERQLVTCEKVVGVGVEIAQLFLCKDSLVSFEINTYTGEKAIRSYKRLQCQSSEAISENGEGTDDVTAPSLISQPNFKFPYHGISNEYHGICIWKQMIVATYADRVQVVTAEGKEILNMQVAFKTGRKGEKNIKHTKALPFIWKGDLLICHSNNLPGRALQQSSKFPVHVITADHLRKGKNSSEDTIKTINSRLGNGASLCFPWHGMLMMFQTRSAEFQFFDPSFEKIKQWEPKLWDDEEGGKVRHEDTLPCMCLLPDGRLAVGVLGFGVIALKYVPKKNSRRSLNK